MNVWYRLVDVYTCSIQSIQFSIVSTDGIRLFFLLYNRPLIFLSIHSNSYRHAAKVNCFWRNYKVYWTK